MSDHEKRERNLRQLLEDNFIISRHFRKYAEAITDVSLKQYFKSLASRRSQFAIELGEEIAFHGGKLPYMSPSAYDRQSSLELTGKFKYINSAMEFHKQSVQKYQAALGEINDGSCREILLRHKAFIENCIFELKSLKTLLKYKRYRNGEISEASSNV